MAPAKPSLGSYFAPPRARGTAREEPPPRPGGDLLWCHATLQSHVDVALTLRERLTVQRPKLNLLLTIPDGMALPERIGNSTICTYLPAESTGATEAFLSHWEPDLCIWTAGDLRPALLSQAQKRRVPLYLVDADEARLTRPGWRLLPDATKQTLKRFQTIFARNAGTEIFLRRRFGLRDAHIEVTGTLREASKPLRYNESDREELTGLLRGRPVWLAAHLQPGEIETVLKANMEVIRMSHRALLIVAPASPRKSEPFQETLTAFGLRYIAWSSGALPDETTQAILADTENELGLWYRVSPISFMGGSLVPDTHGSDPNEPAAHGSAILYGPNIRTYLDSYSRYAEAGGARIVRDAETLAAAVRRLIPPDQSASMAHAAWDVVTQGAEVMDRLVDMVDAVLDERKRR
ncbi:MAG: glycosyltransferase N-terminal domain-containing protein [Roseovarius sp.]